MFPPISHTDSSVTFTARNKRPRASNGRVKSKTISQDTATFNKQQTEKLLEQLAKDAEAERLAEEEAWIPAPGGATNKSESIESPVTSEDEETDQSGRWTIEKLYRRQQYLRKVAEKEEEQRKLAEAKRKPAFVIPPPEKQAKQRQVKAELTKDHNQETVGSRNNVNNQLKQMLRAHRPERVSIMTDIDAHEELRHLGSKPDLYIDLLLMSDVAFFDLKRTFEQHCKGNLDILEREYKKYGETLFSK
jgi:hypothetical protein